MDDIEVKSAQRVGYIAPQIIHLNSLPVYESNDWEFVPIHKAGTAEDAVVELLLCHRHNLFI